MFTSKKHILFLSLILLGGLLVYFVFSSGLFTAQAGREHEVVLTAEGFSPASLTINKGDTVTFVTTLGKPFWPASDLHPTHGIFPEFDPKEPVESSQTWSFKFNKNGTWKYHDHLFSSYRGVIVVEDKAKEYKSFSVSECDTAENRTKCWADIIANAIDEDGLDKGFELLAELYDTYPEFANNCHSNAHEIGIAAYEKFSKGEELELVPKTYYCGYGFYHGFMETLLQKEGNADKAREFCVDVGKKLSKWTSDAEGACYHGIGHGAVDGGDPRTWGDPQKMIEPGLRLCEKVSETKDKLHLYRCVTGVFNAIEILARDPKYNINKIVQEPFSLCPSQPDNYKEACYTNMMPALYALTGNDFNKIAKEIEKIPPAGDRESLALVGQTVRGMVALSLGYDFIMFNLMEPDYNISGGVTLCRSMLSELRLPCVEGLAGGHMKFGKPESEYVMGLEFCRSELLREDERNACFNHILSRLRLWYTSEKAMQICKDVPEKYRGYCAL